MKSIVVLLTGTVAPGQMALTKLVDPAIRRNQYISSLNFWIEATTLPLVFVENSGTDLSPWISEQHRGRIEFLTFQGNSYPKNLGKGYGELKCLHYAIIHSKFIKNAAFVFKATGRYKIPNFENFARYYEHHRNIDIFLDLKDSLTFADSRFFGFRPAFVETYLIKRQTELDDGKGCLFERILAKATLDAVLHGNVFRQFPCYPKYTGVSGTENKPYQTGILFFAFKQIKYYFKSRFMSGY